MEDATTPRKVTVVQPDGQTRKPEIVGPDQEAWVQDRLRTLVLAVLNLREAKKVRADQIAFDYGVSGLVQGTAIEIIRTLGKEPGFVNLRNEYRYPETNCQTSPTRADTPNWDLPGEPSPSGRQR